MLTGSSGVFLSKCMSLSTLRYLEITRSTQTNVTHRQAKPRQHRALWQQPGSLLLLARTYGSGVRQTWQAAQPCPAPQPELAALLQKVAWWAEGI